MGGHIRKNRVVYSLFLIALCLGIGVGMFRAPPLISVQGEASELVARIMSGNLTLVPFATAFTNQMLWAVLIWFLGITVVGFFAIFPVIAFKGYCLGFTVSALTAGAGPWGLLAGLSAVVPQNIIYVPAIFYLGAAALTFSSNIVDGRLRGADLMRSFVVYSLMLAIGLVLIAAGALVECRLTPRLLGMVLGT